MRRECPKLSEDVIWTTECRNIGSKRMFRVTCSFSLKSLLHSSAITSFLLRYPDLVSPRTFSVKKFHRISWNHYLIGREYRQENYPEMWNLGSADRTMSAARALSVTHCDDDDDDLYSSAQLIFLPSVAKYFCLQCRNILAFSVQIFLPKKVTKRGWSQCTSTGIE